MGGGGVQQLCLPVGSQVVRSATTLPKLGTRMQLLPVGPDVAELEEKVLREHCGVLYMKGGYTTKAGTLVWLVLYNGTYMMLQHVVCHIT